MKALLRALAATVACTLSFALPAWGEPGDLDLTFNGTGKVTTSMPGRDGTGTSVAVLSSGRILVAGTAATPSWDSSHFAVVRLNANGSLDTTFNGTGKLILDVGNFARAPRLAVQKDGKFILAAPIGDGLELLLMRLTAAGAPDTSFNGTGQVVATFGAYLENDGCGLALQPDGRIVVASGVWSGSDYELVLARHKANGSLDETFNGSGVVRTNLGSTHDVARAVAIQPDGRIVIAGQVGDRFLTGRYNADGTVDTTFAGSGFISEAMGTGSAYAYAVALQSDGRIVVAGDAEGVGVARYQSNGAADLSFNGSGIVSTQIAGGYVGAVRGVAVQPDGKIVVAGEFCLSSGSDADALLLRYNADGSLDASFGNDGVALADFNGRWDGGRAVALQPDGKIVVAGYAMRPDDGYDLAVMRFLGQATEGTARFSSHVTVVSESARTAVVTVERINAYRGTLTVNFETADGTATNGEDYVAISGTLVFGPGQRTRVIRVPLLPDAIADGAETVNLTLKSGSGVRTLDTAVLVLREGSLAFAPRKVEPGQAIKVIGHFDPAQALYVRFCDHLGNDTVIRAGNVTTRTARVRVPIFYDPATGEPGAALLTVEARQDDVVLGPVARVAVAAPSITGQTPGVFTLEYLRALRELCAMAEQKWAALDGQSEGALDSTELRTTLAGMQTGLQQLEDELQPVVDGSQPEWVLGTVGAQTLSLNATSLAILDRMLVAAVFEGKFTPATAGFARLRALAEQDPLAAAAKPTSTDDFRDELNPTLQKKVSGVFGLAKKYQERGMTALGKAKEAILDYLGEPGPPNEYYKEPLSANYYLITIDTAGRLGSAADATAEPYVRLENRRAVRKDEFYSPQDAVARWLKESCEFESETLQTLEDLLALPERAGTFRDRVHEWRLRFEIKASNVQALAISDPTSHAATLNAQTDVIFSHRPEPIVSIQTPDAWVVEPATGSRTASFLVTLDTWPSGPVYVDVDALSGTAHAGVDFATPPARLKVSSGPNDDVFAWLNVPVLSDNEDDEGTETFEVRISNAQNARIGDSAAMGYIRDAKRHWTIDVTVNVEGFGTYPFTQEVELPRSGGSVKFSTPYGGYATVSTTATTMTVSARGLGGGGGTEVEGGGSGSGPIVVTPAGASASGPVSGSIRIRDPGFPWETHAVSGSFSATGNY